MVVQIPGKIVQGFGAATSALAYQWSEVSKHVAELPRFHQGTINVRLSAPVLVTQPDIVVPAFEWGPQNQKESFGIVRVKFEFPKGKLHGAIMYISSGSPHRFDLATAEIITEKLDGVEPGHDCAVHFFSFTGIII